jgi:DNA-binding NarL/FixJ family response regulator
VIALTADLFFRAKIEEAAKALGLARPRFASSAEQAGKLAGEEPAPGALVLLELGPRTGGVEAVAKIKELAPGARIVAFGSHVDTETLERARSLGATEVMARSRFANEMPRIMGTP